MLRPSGGGSHDPLGQRDTPRSIAARPLRDSPLLSCPGCIPCGARRFRQRFPDKYGLARVGLGFSE
jgi:hypothetical protein